MMSSAAKCVICVALMSALLYPASTLDAVSATQRVGDFARAKESPIVSPWAADVIAKTTREGRARVWVYFTDKGFTSQAGLAAAVQKAESRLTARAVARRSKMGRASVEFIDLPVNAAYVEQVRGLGGQLRSISRWLNAASFDVEVSRLGEITSLPFVARVAPMVGMKREPVVTGDVKPSPIVSPPKSAGSETIDYGFSLDQLTQINVPAVHNIGFKGQGVLVCMIDTGYRKDHTTFAQAYAEGRVIAEHDFIFDDGNTQDEPEDAAGQNNHGTYCWSTLGGAADGLLYGPAFKADFILAKTEDIRSETPIEEDYWVEAMEWADSIGAQVISTSLGYTDWYTYADKNGDICVTTVAADLAAALGIVVCVSNGNAGSSPGTMNAPADGDSVVAVGAVSSTGVIASFSSRGPTFDGRIKPEVCARGVSTYCANPSNPLLVTTASGTSLSCPLVGGCAAVLLSAHPNWTPMQVREALMMTASQSATPDNNYGWGIVNLLAALTYNQSFLPGDLNYDGFVDALDLALEIDIVYFDLAYPPPPASPDLNLDGVVNSPDVVLLIDYVFRGGVPPPYPTN